jgi:hypothetical protein
MLTSIAADAIHKLPMRRNQNLEGCLRRALSDEMTMTYVLEVKESMKAANCEFLTSILWK